MPKVTDLAVKQVFKTSPPVSQTGALCPISQCLPEASGHLTSQSSWKTQECPHHREAVSRDHSCLKQQENAQQLQLLCLCTCSQLHPENNGFPFPSSTEFQGWASYRLTVTWNYAEKDAGKCSSQSSFQGGMLVLITQYNLPLFSTQIHETFLTHVHLPTNLMFLPHMRHLPLVQM